MSTATLTPDAIDYVCTTVRQRSAIELDASKAYLIEARLVPVARETGFASLNEFIQGARSKRKADLETRLVEALTTNETSFFRDLHPFEALRLSLLQEVRTRNASKKTLNIWSAACSTGQELYSIAMLIKENFSDLASWNVQLLGTDLSDEVLQKAKAARYSQVEVNRGLSAPRLLKFFQRDGMTWQLNEEFRNMARFQKLNLIETWPLMPPMDIVFLRNVLIYFSPETKKAILQKVKKVMAPKAVLFLGAAETTLGLDDSFERIQLNNSVFYRLS